MNGPLYYLGGVETRRHRDERKQIAEMLGEFLREASVLVLVFFPLDLAMQGKISPRRVVAIVTLSGVTLALGIVLERMREP